MITAIDRAFAEMAGAEDEDTLRLAFWGVIADARLFLLLEREAEPGQIVPKVFDLQDGPVILAFDSEERLASFTGTISAYAELPGRAIAAQLAGQGVGLGLNLGAPSQTILPHEAMGWLIGLLEQMPDEVRALPEKFLPPDAAPVQLKAALQSRVNALADLCGGILLAAVEYQGGGRGLLLAFLDAKPEVQAALAQTAADAVRFSGLSAASMDVVFLQSDDPRAQAMERAGLRFDPPPEPLSIPGKPAAPGSDPDRPPILR